MQDMIPPRGDRSIRNITISTKHHRAGPEFEGPPPPARHRRPRRRGRLISLLAGVVVVCAALGVLVSTVFAGARIVAYPNIQEVTLPSSIEAEPNAPSGVLAYQTMSITQSASTTLQANGTQHVSKQATGVVTIYNNY